MVRESSFVAWLFQLSIQQLAVKPKTYAPLRNRVERMQARMSGLQASPSNARKPGSSNLNSNSPSGPGRLWASPVKFVFA